MEKEVKRYDLVNILRMVCAYLVIVIHSIAFNILGSDAKYITSDFICRIAVPFFFITAGYFFYTKVNKAGYFKNYIKKLVIIYIIITIVYSVVLIPLMYSAFIKRGLGFILKTFLVNGISGALWYFPGLIISIVFVYIFLKKNLIKPLMIISVVLFIIGLMGDSYYGLIVNTPLIYIVKGYNFIFDTTRNGITFGVPFIMLGVLINKYKLNERIKKPAIFLVLFCAVFGIEAYFLMHSGIPKDYNIYFSAVLVVPIIFIMALNSKIKISEGASNYMREMSLWIYAFHSLVLIVSGNLKMFQQNSFAIYLLACGITTLIAFIITRFRLRKKVLNKKFSKRVVISSLSIILISAFVADASNQTAQNNGSAVFASNEKAESSNVTGCMWKISDDDSSIYLDMSFPIGEKETYPLSNTAEKVLEESDEIVLYATDINPGTDPSFDSKIFYTNGDSLKNHITEEGYNIFLNKMKEVKNGEIDEEGINQCKIILKLNVIISKYSHTNRDEYRYILDDYLKYKANKLNKKIDYMFDGTKFTEDTYDINDDNVSNAYAMLSKYYDDKYTANIKEAYNAWKLGDSDKVIELYNKFNFQNDEDKKNYEKYKKIVNDYEDKVNKPYNDKTLENIEGYLKDNKKFLVLLDIDQFEGNHDILKELKDKNYKVEKITE